MKNLVSRSKIGVVVLPHFGIMRTNIIEYPAFGMPHKIECALRFISF